MLHHDYLLVVLLTLILYSLRRKHGTNLVWRTVGLFAAMILLPQVGSGRTAATDAKQPWQAPADAKTVKNPVKSTPGGLKNASDLYVLRCLICHGYAGGGNGPQSHSLPQKPAKFSDTKIMKTATDGELFWKISTGNAPMPSWQGQLSETQRWELVNYLRQLATRGEYRYLGQPINAPTAGR